MSFPEREAYDTPEGTLSVQPGRPDTIDHAFEIPRVILVNEDGHVFQSGRKIKLRGEWTLRQYRNPVPCGAHYALHPGPGATYQWEVIE